MDGASFLVGVLVLMGPIGGGILYGAFQRYQERKRQETLSKERRTWERAGPQLVGQACPECDETIVIEFEAIQCPECARAVHEQCALRHTHAEADGHDRRKR